MERASVLALASRPGPAVPGFDRTRRRRVREVLDRHGERRRVAHQRRRQKPATHEERRGPRDDRGRSHAHTIRNVPAVSADTPFAVLAREAQRIGVRLDSATLGLCERYAGLLIDRNTSVNLTAITAPLDVARKH